MTTWIIYLAPVGVLFLIAGQIMAMDDFGDTFARLGWYFCTVLIGLFVHGFIVLPLIFSRAKRATQKWEPNAETSLLSQPW